MEFSSDVTIIGAGLNGLTLSLALERVGLKVTLIDSGDFKKKVIKSNFDLIIFKIQDFFCCLDCS